MAPAKRNPEAGGLGARKADVLLATAKNSSENNRSLADLQALFVARRSRVSLALATVIASHAFETRRRA